VAELRDEREIGKMNSKQQCDQVRFRTGVALSGHRHRGDGETKRRLGRTSTMKKILLAAAAAVSLAASVAPASAQPFRFDGDFGHFGAREARAERQIAWCTRFGNMSFREAQQLRFELRLLQRQIAVARFNGVSRWEFLAIERRMDQIERQIRRDCRDLNGRGPFDHRGPRF
jgi:hypothetical protein